MSFCQNFIPSWIFSSWIGSLLNSTYVVEKSLSGYCKNFRAAHRESNAHAHFVPEITYNKRTGWWWSCHIRIYAKCIHVFISWRVLYFEKRGIAIAFIYLIFWVTISILKEEKVSSASFWMNKVLILEFVQG